MALAVDAGVTQDWPEWARGVWAATLIVGLLAAVFILLYATGVLNDESIAARGRERRDGRVLSVRHFVTVYAGTLVAGVVLSVWLEDAHGVDGERTIAGIGGALFLLASLGRPWWLYETIRRLGWFDIIESDKAMRGLLAALGAGLVGIALFRST